jgi:hypothetical protein
MDGGKPGKVVVLNGVARSGKTSIAEVIQRTLDGIWMNLGMDLQIRSTPAPYQPGVGLRPQLPEWICESPRPYPGPITRRMGSRPLRGALRLGGSPRAPWAQCRHGRLTP